MPTRRSESTHMETRNRRLFGGPNLKLVIFSQNVIHITHFSVKYDTDNFFYYIRRTNVRTRTEDIFFLFHQLLNLKVEFFFDLLNCPSRHFWYKKDMLFWESPLSWNFRNIFEIKKKITIKFKFHQNYRSHNSKLYVKSVCLGKLTTTDCNN